MRSHLRTVDWFQKKLEIKQFFYESNRWPSICDSIKNGIVDYHKYGVGAIVSAPNRQSNAKRRWNVAICNFLERRFGSNHLQCILIMKRSRYDISMALYSCIHSTITSILCANMWASERSARKIYSAMFGEMSTFYWFNRSDIYLILIIPFVLSLQWEIWWLQSRLLEAFHPFPNNTFLTS